MKSRFLVPGLSAFALVVSLLVGCNVPTEALSTYQARSECAEATSAAAETWTRAIAETEGSISTLRSNLCPDGARDCIAQADLLIEVHGLDLTDPRTCLVALQGRANSPACAADLAVVTMTEEEVTVAGSSLAAELATARARVDAACGIVVGAP